MKTLHFLLASALIIALSAFTIDASVNWKIADGYSVKFISKDPTGVFTKMDGSIQFDPNNLENSRFDVKVDVNSINTGKGMQNKHAVSADWFDAETYPYIHFVSQRIDRLGNDYKASGTMEIKGIKKTFDIPFTFENNVFSGKFEVNRTDFGIGAEHKKVPAILAVELSVPVTQ
jgi:polyisoprenoid-binding protein YceI